MQFVLFVHLSEILHIPTGHCPKMSEQLALYCILNWFCIYQADIWYWKNSSRLFVDSYKCKIESNFINLKFHTPVYLNKFTIIILEENIYVHKTLSYKFCKTLQPDNRYFSFDRKDTLTLKLYCLNRINCVHNFL